MIQKGNSSKRRQELENSTFETAEKEERLILVAVATSDGDDTVQSLDELEELGQTAGAVTVAKVVQNREKVHPGTYIGKGKIEEVRRLVLSTNADTVVCDDELSPAQNHNLEEALNVKVIDRTVLILDIFAKRASTSEGKLQVELAQLRYRLSHLTGERSNLSRLGGGIGTRGPGEQKLEMDRRIIKQRITQVRKELVQVKHTRELTRKKRQENPVPVVAITGYTNAGKSTLLNKLTGAGVLSENKLFATLDPVTRKYEFENGGEMLFTDTVGFIRKLPHHLVQAFRGTLEEAKYADIILHVADCSNPDMDAQMFTVYETLDKLGIGDKKIITAFNKIDLENSGAVFKDLRADKTVMISARNGTGLEELLEVLKEAAKEGKRIVEKTFSYNEAAKVNEIHKTGQIIEEEYRNEGIYIKAQVPKEYMYMFENPVK
ncbi:MAG: GTPase HflX [Lachnospiraceae bacterium]|jgi:GTP-binding protein HflX